MKISYNRYFPTPSYLSMHSFALDISDQSIKYGELLATPSGLRIGRFGRQSIPFGIVTAGKIDKEEELVLILKDLVRRENLHYVRVSLPEEQMYLFKLSLPIISLNNLYDTILLQLEEHIPLKASDATFDYGVVSQNEQTVFVEVLATATNTIESYLSAFKKAGLVPLSFELEAQAIARAVIPYDDLSSVMIVDFGEARTGASIAHDGRVFFTTTLDIGGIAITNMIAKNFSLSFEEAEKMKMNYGINSASNVDEIFPAILNGISVLRDELNRHYIYWKTHEDEGTKHEKLDRIILCGGDANLAGLSNYLEVSMSIKVENANAWVNISDMKISVPNISFEDSFGYTTVLGLALLDYMENPHSKINVLPEREKKLLQREYWMKFGGVICSFLAFAGLIAILLVLPPYFLSISKSNIASEQLEAFNAANPEIAAQNTNTITDINSKLTLLGVSDASTYPSGTILEDLVLPLPKGITLSNILYNEAKEGKTLKFQGQALNRTTLYNFKNSLDQNPHFASVDLPISDFLNKSNISFTISVTLK